MTAQEFQQLVGKLESELKSVGCDIDGTYRGQVERVLDRMDHVTTPEDAEAMYAEVGRDLGDPHLPVVCSPAVWMRAIECA